MPPSHNAVIYSLATGGTISIISLFMAGVVPGLLLFIIERIWLGAPTDPLPSHGDVTPHAETAPFE